MPFQILPNESSIEMGLSPDIDLSTESNLPHLLIVDDENGPRQALRMLFKEHYEVHMADHVMAGLEEVRSKPIEVIVTDIRMPQYTGVDLLREVKQINPDIQVIIITGYGQLETAMKAVEYGAFAYMEKPFDNDVMMDMVQSAQDKFKMECERRVFEDLAMEASRFETLGRLVSGTMHDLGTPLTVLSSHIELMLMVPEKDGIEKRLETMKAQVQYCAELTKATMNYLRYDQDESGLVQINQIINTCISVSKPLVRETKVELIAELNEDLPFIKGDTVLLRQVIMNLIANACQAMRGQEQEKLLYIKSWLEDDKVYVSVEDTGPGIPNHQREHVFEMFFSTKGKSGTGLGLGVVRNVLRRFKGAVKLEDGKHGTGAHFVMYLPNPEAAAGTGTEESL
jgi:signal transduction histidine kinase